MPLVFKHLNMTPPGRIGPRKAPKRPEEGHADLIPEHCEIDGCGMDGYRWFDCRMPNTKNKTWMWERLRLCTLHWARAIRSPDQCPLDTDSRTTWWEVDTARWLVDEMGMTHGQAAERLGIATRTLSRRINEDAERDGPEPQVRAMLQRHQKPGGGAANRKKAKRKRT